VPEATRSVLLVDGECGVCCWLGLRIAGRVDGMRITTIQREIGGPLLEGMTADRALESWHLHTGARTTSGAAAFAGLFDVAGHRRAASIARRAEPLIDPVYRFGARHRGVWARVVPKAARRRSQAALEKG
jgi:predicted DCC family thiol-disulfide oxidoreductase YuxK